MISRGTAFAGLILGLVLAVMGPAVAQSTPDPDRDAVATVFRTAQEALTRGDGAGALALLSRTSRTRLEALHRTAMSGSAKDVAGLTPSEKFVVLGLRRHIDPQRLRGMSLERLADHALAQGWLGPRIIGSSTLGPVDIAEDRAVATVLVDGRPLLIPADFVRDPEGWRFDVTRLMQLSDGLISASAMAARQSEEGMIEGLLDRLATPRQR